ncbi:homeobox-leucine zipper protein HOX3 [Solanum dulcamara]|uniref:homeobox-leucine zipper protein HOX3 n=1 Tax=Solanum dulcamara TaxID=45834 RepID=UPI002485DB90|nr:homeobox-leucine zipper protein HOX3 [Solanum dulcamara]
MESMPESSTCLELTISIPGSSSNSSSFPSSGEGGGGYNMMRELDINQVPSSGNINEEDVSMGKEKEEEESSNININISGAAPRKKLRLTKQQSFLLEESFRQNHTLNPKQKEALAMQLNLKARQVEVWFQNRRARSKLKQTEMECEYLKRWFGSLTEQNRRLKKEVEELRAMKVGPPTVLSPHTCQPLPASTLTMCPQCERITATNVRDESKI